MYKVIHYPENGNALINGLLDDILLSGDSRNYSDFLKYLEKLAAHGFKMNIDFKAQSYKKLDKDLYELRPKNFRILFTFKDNTFYILNGFFKKTQEAPVKQLDIARKHVKEIFGK